MKVSTNVAETKQVIAPFRFAPFNRLGGLGTIIAIIMMFVSNYSYAQFSIAASSTNYTENFNSLASTGASNTWTNNSTLTGWYARTDATATISTYGANTGSTTAAGLYSYGVAGTNAITERALGFAASNAFTGASGTGKAYLGWRLKNNTGSPISSILVTWTGEQWRKDNTVNQSLVLTYQQAATVTALTSGTWTSAGSTFTSPIITSGGAALDGNASANRVANISVTITVSIPAGEEIMLRWEDLNDAGNDHHLTIDDVTINATGGSTTPTVTTTIASSITTNSAASGGDVTSDGGSTITARGVAFGTSANPTTGTSESGTTGVFTSTLSSLSVNTQYFYRAYATNANGTAYGSESNFYTLANTPGAPTVNNPTTGSLDVTIDVNGNPSGTQFAIQEVNSGNYVNGSGALTGTPVWQGAAAWATTTVTGLSINTNYSFRVKARNNSSVETGFGTAVSLYTLANTPGTPPVFNATTTTLDVSIAQNSNPSTTQFAIEETGSGNFVQADGSLGATPVWQVAGGGGWGGTVTVNGLASNTTYNFREKARNGNNVETSFGGTGSGTTLAGGTPILSANTLTAFGNVCLNVTTSANTFTITGTDLTSADVTVASLSGFTFSTDDITYTASLSITQGGGAFSQLIYVKFTPTAVQSYDGNIVVGGGGATSINVAASGSGINTLPTVTAGVATGITLTGATVPGTITNNGCSAVSAYGVEYSTTPLFANGTGTAVPGNNLSGNDFSVTLSGLNNSTTYYYHTYATSASGTGYSAEGSFTTLTPTLSVGALSGFGNVCINTTTAANTFTITGTDLTTADVTVGPLSGFTFSTDDITYNSSLNISQAGGAFSQTIYVKFNPTAVQSYDGNIPVGGGGAATVNRSVTGSGVNTSATVSTNAASGITQFTATLNGSYTEVCSSVTSYGFEYSTTNNFSNGSGTNVPSSNQSSGVFSAGISGLDANTTYYYKAWATDNGGTSYGAQQSFTTAQLDAPNATAATTITSSSFQANWDAVTGATGYRLDVSKYATFTTSDATDLFFSEYLEGSSNNKYIEIYNGTGASVNLGDYKVQIYSNGSGTVSNELTLSGSLANGSTYVIRNSSATIFGGANLSWANLNYNGDDAVALFKISSNAFVDIFGSIGFDPGTAWTGAGGYTTFDKTLRRKPSVSSGLTSNPASSFPTLTTEWDLFNIDVISDLGSHTYTANNPSFVAGYNNLAVAGTSQSVTGLTPGTTYYYRVRATSTNSTSANSNVISATTCVDLPVSVSIAAAPGETVCAGTSVTFTATPTNGGTTPTYQWYLNAGLLSGETASTYTTSTLANGDQVSVVMTSSESCTTGNPATSNTITMTVNALPSVSFSGLSASYCVTGVPATLTGSPAGGTFSGTGISGNTFDPSAAGVGGPYSITYSYTDVNGCSNSASQNVSVTAAENVDWANLQWPPTGTICEGGTHTAYGQVYEAGVTEAGGQGAGITVEIGLSNVNDNSNPNTWTNWQPATFNTQVGNNDEYTATFGNTLAAGTYYYTFRYSRNGCGYQYGGYSSGGGNFWDGTTYVSGVLTVNPTLNASVSIVATPGETICAGTSVTFTATPTNGGSSPTYQWYNGATPISGETASTYTTSTLVNGDAISVQMVSNASPCLGTANATSNTITMTVIPNLPVSVAIAANPGNTICDGTSVTFTATPTNGGTTPTYQWYNGASPISGETASTYTSSSLVNGDQISVVMTSNEVCTSGNPATSNTITMTVNANQPVSVSIAANPGNAVCPGTSVTFTATPTNGGTTPTYQWYNGATPISGETASTYTTTTLVNGDQISVVMTSDLTPCATGNPATSNTITMTVYTAANTPGAISGPIDACPLIGLVTPTTYSISAVAGAVSYQWTVPVGVTLVSGQGSTSIDVTFDNTFALTNSQFKVRAVTADGCISAASALIVNKNIPAIPAVINGPTNACPYTGQPVTVTYSVAAVQYATSYTWTVQGTGISLVSGQGSTSVEVSFATNFNTGVIRVVANSNCGARSARSLNISRQIPTAPVAINGTTSVCSFIGTNTQVTYSIDPVPNATSYTWTVPANTTLVSGQGTTSINVTFQTGFATSVLKVKSVSNCFTSGDRQLTLTAASTSTPGAITGPNNACVYIGTANEATYTIRKVNSATSYNWTVPTGVTITGHPAGTGVNDTTITVTFDNSFVSGTNISVQAVNCNVSSPRNYTVFRYTASTPGLISGPTNACEYMVSANLPPGAPATYTIRKVANATSYTWTAPANATITAHPGGTGVNDTIVEVTFSAGFTTGSLQVTASNGCGTSTARTLAISKQNAGTPGGIDVVMTQSCPNREFTYTIAAMPSNATSAQWTVPVGATIISGQGTTSITVAYPATAVSGAVTVTGYNNCSNGTTRSITVKLAACPGERMATVTGKGENTLVAESMNVQVFPNPTTTDFKLQVLTAGKEKIVARVMDAQGRMLKQVTVQPYQTINIGSDLKAGAYILEVRQGAAVKTTRITKF